jgi:uncharacterized membrane protein
MLDNSQSNLSSLRSKHAGYFEGIKLHAMLKFAENKGINIKIDPVKGEYLLPGTVLLKYDGDIDTEAEEKLREFFYYTHQQNIEDNYVFGFKQITEVGVKAMSPGINDPGTAIITIDYLTDLIALRMQIRETHVHHSGDFSVEFNTLQFQTLLYQILASYRMYCKHDVLLMGKLIIMLKYLRQQPCSQKNYVDILESELNIISEDINNNITNKADQDKLAALISRNN